MFRRIILPSNGISTDFINFENCQNIYDNIKTKIYHADLYRVENVKDLNEIGFFDIVNTNDWLFVEWPKKIIDLIDKPFSIVNINIEDENNRKIELKNK